MSSRKQQNDRGMGISSGDSSSLYKQRSMPSPHRFQMHSSSGPHSHYQPYVAASVSVTPSFQEEQSGFRQSHYVPGSLTYLHDRFHQQDQRPLSHRDFLDASHEQEARLREVELLQVKKRPSLLSADTQYHQHHHASVHRSTFHPHAGRERGGDTYPYYGQENALASLSCMAVPTHSQLGPTQLPKRPRLSDRPDIHAALRVDISAKPEPAYTPQVEAISPTLPTEDSSNRQFKEELLANISKKDGEISTMETQIAKLKKKLEMKVPPDIKRDSPELPIAETRNQSLAQIIYAENRRKADSAHRLMDWAGPKVELPLYHQPSDTQVYHDNKKRHKEFRARLILHLQRKHQARRIRERYLTDRYDELMQRWMKKMEKVQNNAKRKQKDLRTREYFEKIFPEIRKIRDVQERFSRYSKSNTRSSIGQAYARSEADLEQLIDGLHEQEVDERKMRMLAVIPPIMLDARQRSLRFLDNNGLIEDPMTVHKENVHTGHWTAQEKLAFQEKYLQSPKNFALIAASLPRKTVSDCIQFYYLTKKNMNYKQLLRKQSMKRNKKALQKSQQQQDVLLKHDVKDETAAPGCHAADSFGKNGKEMTELMEIGDSGSYFQVEGCSEGGSWIQRCCLCQAPLGGDPNMSRALAVSQCEMYGVCQEDLKPDSRVCSNCRCRVVRRKYSQRERCPIPTCRTAKRKVKRLRPFPQKWHELSLEAKHPIIVELQLTPEMSRCCSACFNRIARLLDSHLQATDSCASLLPDGQVSSDDKDPHRLPQWTAEEIDRMKHALCEHGSNWVSVAIAIATKSDSQCRGFYLKNRERFGLDTALREFKGKCEQRTTSICESVISMTTAGSDVEDDVSSSEEDNGDGDDSDTASASSPTLLPTDEALSTSEMLPGVLPSYANHCEDYGMVPTSTSLPLPTSFTNTNLLSASQSLLRSVDNDSSATMSADESPASTTVASLLTTSFSAGNESVFGLTAESGPSAAYYTRASNDNMKNCGVESNLASQCPSVGRPLSSRSAASCVDLSSNYRGNRPASCGEMPAIRKLPDSRPANQGYEVANPSPGRTPPTALLSPAVYSHAPPQLHRPYSGQSGQAEYGRQSFLPDLAGLGGAERRGKAPTSVRDLIHSAVERNIKQPSADCSIASSVEQRRMQGHPMVLVGPTAYPPVGNQLQLLQSVSHISSSGSLQDEPVSHRHVLELSHPSINSSNSGDNSDYHVDSKVICEAGDDSRIFSNLHSVGEGKEVYFNPCHVAEAQDLSCHQSEYMDKGVFRYKGNPHNFEPSRPCAYDPYARCRPELGHSLRRMAVPPPAHSHHTPGGQSDSPYMKNPRRPDSKSRSPMVYQSSHPSPNASPYSPLDGVARDSPTVRIPPPPPLITTGSVKTHPRLPHSTLLSTVFGQGHSLMAPPAGSITHGTPVSYPPEIPDNGSHQVTVSRRSEASRQSMPFVFPSSAFLPTARPEGSITKGTPVQSRSDVCRSVVDFDDHGHGGHDIHEGVCGHPGAAFYDHRLSGSPSDRSAASQPASHEGAVPGFYNYPGSGFMRDHSLSTSRATLMRDYFTAHQQMSRQHKAAEGEERSPRGRDISPTSHLRTADLRVRHFTPPPMSTVHPSAISGRIAAQHLPTNEYRQPSIPSDGMHIRFSPHPFTYRSQDDRNGVNRSNQSSVWSNPRGVNQHHKHAQSSDVDVVYTQPSIVMGTGRSFSHVDGGFRTSATEIINNDQPDSTTLPLSAIMAAHHLEQGQVQQSPGHPSSPSLYRSHPAHLSVSLCQQAPDSQCGKDRDCMATFPRPSCRSAWEQRLQMQHSNDADNVCSKQSLALQQQQVPDNQFANRNSRTSISVDRQQDVAIPTTVKQLTTSSAENADNGVFGQEGAWRGHPGTEIGGSVQHRSSILRHRWPVPFWHDLPPPASNAYINARMEAGAQRPMTDRGYIQKLAESKASSAIMLDAFQKDKDREQPLCRSSLCGQSLTAAVLIDAIITHNIKDSPSAGTSSCPLRDMPLLDGGGEAAVSMAPDCPGLQRVTCSTGTEIPAATAQPKADLPHSPIVTQSSLRSSAPNKSTHSPSHACAGNSSELRSSVQSTRGGVGVWPRMSQAAGSTLLLPCSFDGSSSSSSSCDSGTVTEKASRMITLGDHIDAIIINDYTMRTGQLARRDDLSASPASKPLTCSLLSRINSTSNSPPDDTEDRSSPLGKPVTGSGEIPSSQFSPKKSITHHSSASDRAVGSSSDLHHISPCKFATLSTVRSSVSQSHREVAHFRRTRGMNLQQICTEDEQTRNQQHACGSPVHCYPSSAHPFRATKSENGGLSAVESSVGSDFSDVKPAKSASGSISAKSFELLALSAFSSRDSGPSSNVEGDVEEFQAADSSIDLAGSQQQQRSNCCKLEHTTADCDAASADKIAFEGISTCSPLNAVSVASTTAACAICCHGKAHVSHDHQGHLSSIDNDVVSSFTSETTVSTTAPAPDAVADCDVLLDVGEVVSGSDQDSVCPVGCVPGDVMIGSCPAAPASTATMKAASSHLSPNTDQATAATQSMQHRKRLTHRPRFHGDGAPSSSERLSKNVCSASYPSSTVLTQAVSITPRKWMAVADTSTRLASSSMEPSSTACVFSRSSGNRTKSDMYDFHDESPDEESSAHHRDNCVSEGPVCRRAWKGHVDSSSCTKLLSASVGDRSTPPCTSKAGEDDDAGCVEHTANDSSETHPRESSPRNHNTRGRYQRNNNRWSSSESQDVTSLSAVEVNVHLSTTFSDAEHSLVDSSTGREGTQSKPASVCFTADDRYEKCEGRYSRKAHFPCVEAMMRAETACSTEGSKTMPESDLDVSGINSCSLDSGTLPAGCSSSCMSVPEPDDGCLPQVDDHCNQAVSSMMCNPESFCPQDQDSAALFASRYESLSDDDN